MAKLICSAQIFLTQMLSLKMLYRNKIFKFTQTKIIKNNNKISFRNISLNLDNSLFRFLVYQFLKLLFLLNGTGDETSFVYNPSGGLTWQMSPLSELSTAQSVSEYSL